MKEDFRVLFTGGYTSVEKVQARVQIAAKIMLDANATFALHTRRELDDASLGVFLRDVAHVVKEQHRASFSHQA